MELGIQSQQTWNPSKMLTRSEWRANKITDFVMKQPVFLFYDFFSNPFFLMLYPHYPPIGLSLTATMSLPQLILLAWAASEEEEDKTSTPSTSSLLSPEDMRQRRR